MTKKELATQQNTIVQQLVERLGEQELTLPEDQDQLWDIVQTSEVHACLHQIKAGLAYKALKAQLTHGEFTKQLKDRGIHERHAQRRIAVADLVLHCPALNRQALADLNDGSNPTTLSDLEESPGSSSNRTTSSVLDDDQQLSLGSFSFSQLNELTRLSEEKIQSLQPDELKELSKLPVRALKATVQQINLDFEQENKLLAENHNLKLRVNELEHHVAETINELGHERLRKSPETLFGLPLLVAMVRQKAPSISQELHEHGLNAINLVERVCEPGLDHEQAVIAGTALYHWLAAPYRQLGLALNKLEDVLGVDVINEDSGLPTYSEAEWEQAEERRQVIITSHNHTAEKNRKKRGRK